MIRLCDTWDVSSRLSRDSRVSSRPSRKSREDRYDCFGSVFGSDSCLSKGLSMFLSSLTCDVFSLSSTRGLRTNRIPATDDCSDGGARIFSRPDFTDRVMSVCIVEIDATSDLSSNSDSLYPWSRLSIFSILSLRSLFSLRSLLSPPIDERVRIDEFPIFLWESFILVDIFLVWLLCDSQMQPCNCPNCIE